MKRTVASLLALVLVGCRPPAPAPAQPVEPPTPAVALAPAPEHEPMPPDTSEVAVFERDPLPPGVLPPGVDAASTACEQSCAEVHDCALLDQAYTPSAAASIELGCLGACVSHEAPVTSLFGCERPREIEPASCEPFLACLGPAWPVPTTTPLPAPIVIDSRNGCERACEAFGRCFSAATNFKDISSCASQCREQLSDEQERAIGECTGLPNCEEIMECVLSQPGA